MWTGTWALLPLLRLRLVRAGLGKKKVAPRLYLSLKCPHLPQLWNMEPILAEQGADERRVHSQDCTHMLIIFSFLPVALTTDVA